MVRTSRLGRTQTKPSIPFGHLKRFPLLPKKAARGPILRRFGNAIEGRLGHGDGLCGGRIRWGAWALGWEGGWLMRSVKPRFFWSLLPPLRPSHHELKFTPGVLQQFWRDPSVPASCGLTRPQQIAVWGLEISGHIFCYYPLALFGSFLIAPPHPGGKE